MTMAKAVVSRLGDTCSELGEGAAWDPVTGTAWWFDIVGRKLHEHPLDRPATAHDLPRMGSVFARIDDARQLLAMDDGLYVRDASGGDLSLLILLEDDMPGNRSNDGRVHPSGSLWIGTMGRKAEKEAGTIYHVSGSRVQPIFERVSIPNSICFSSDGSVGYFADTALNTVWRVALDPSTGLPAGEPETFLTAGDLPLGGGFDGSVCDADDLLWNVAWGGGSVSGFTPEGRLVRSFEVPAARATCPCFVGENLDSMIVTTAWEGYSAAEREADPGAGFTYLIDGGFRGRADPAFRL